MLQHAAKSHPNHRELNSAADDGDQRRPSQSNTAESKHGVRDEQQYDDTQRQVDELVRGHTAHPPLSVEWVSPLTHWRRFRQGPPSNAGPVWCRCDVTTGSHDQRSGTW